MKMQIVPAAVWSIFRGRFEANLDVLGAADGKRVMDKAKQRYQTIIGRIPPFGADDVLLVNILSAAMVAAVYLSLPHRVRVEQMKEYYRRSMNDNAVMKLVLRNTHNFSQRRQNRLAKDAEKSRRSTNPYSWRYVFTPGTTLDSFDAVFDRCGICELFRTLAIPEITPALSAYDYEMAEHTNTVFTREYTLASGGPFCDCHYRRRSGYSPIL